MNQYKQEAIRKARRRCLIWTLAVAVHAIFGVYYFVTNPADAVSMMILVPLIVPSLPLLGYFFLVCSCGLVPPRRLKILIK